MTNYRGTNQMHRACGLRMLPAKGGNDPLPLPLRLRLRWSFPPFECQEGNWARIEIDLHWISNGSKRITTCACKEPSTKSTLCNLISERRTQ